MSGDLLWIIGAAIVLLVAGAWFIRKKVGPSVPDALRPGQRLPDFSATDEQGNPVQSTQLIGSPTAMLFVRGNWCPFCTKQVEQLTGYYKEIVDLGAKLIFVTPKPVQTTRRVAEFYDVDFDFWLDDDLNAAKQLGLLLPASVPRDHRKEYGEDTVRPTVLIIDASGVIRYAKLSRVIVDRPNPKVLLNKLKQLSN